MKKNRIHYESKRSRACNAIIRAIGALGEPSTSRQIDEWLWENKPGWVRMAPTPNEFGAMCAWDQRIEAVGMAPVSSAQLTGYSLNTLWGLKEWSQ